MPFHVGYSGPASVSAFMRVENYKDYIQEDNATKPAGLSTDVEMDADSAPNSIPNVDSGLKATLSESSLTEVESQATSELTTVGESQSAEKSGSTLEKPILPSPTDAPPELEDAHKRFVSTFRGRSIHGLTIELPSGYSGLVLRTEERNHTTREVKSERLDTKTKEPPKTKPSRLNGKAKAATTQQPATRSRGRLTRSAAPKPAVITVEDDDEDADEGVPEPSNSTVDVPMDIAQDDDIPDQPEIRKLMPRAQFSSFTLWHADRPVDKGNDDYYRTLTEWISLSHEVRQNLFS